MIITVVAMALKEKMLTKARGRIVKYIIYIQEMIQSSEPSLLNASIDSYD